MPYPPGTQHAGEVGERGPA